MLRRKEPRPNDLALIPSPRHAGPYRKLSKMADAESVGLRFERVFVCVGLCVCMCFIYMGTCSNYVCYIYILVDTIFCL